MTVSDSLKTSRKIKAVLFDFGGVITASPFEAFTRYEKAVGAPDGIIRAINSTNPNENAWAQMERNESASTNFVNYLNKRQSKQDLRYRASPFSSA